MRTPRASEKPPEDRFVVLAVIHRKGKAPLAMLTNVEPCSRQEAKRRCGLYNREFKHASAEIGEAGSAYHVIELPL